MGNDFCEFYKRNPSLDELKKIDTHIWAVILRADEKAKLARKRAKAAKKAGNTKKWDKFNAVARAYEMTSSHLSCPFMPF